MGGDYIEYFFTVNEKDRKKILASIVKACQHVFMTYEQIIDQLRARVQAARQQGHTDMALARRAKVLGRDLSYRTITNFREGQMPSGSTLVALDEVMTDIEREMAA